MKGQIQTVYEFGPFRFDPEERTLMRDGKSLPLPPKVAETLSLLLQNAGRLVDKDKLIKGVWPDAFVEEGNLNKNIFVLRKTLGQWDGGREYIETVPKRGYRFVGIIEQSTSIPKAERLTADNGSSLARLSSFEAAGWRRSLRSTFYVAVGALALVVIFVAADVGGYRGRLFGHTAVPRIESLAVLPLANLSGDPEQDYFADGMTETLIANLARVSALRVISRTSVMHYKGANQTLPKIARDLNVDAIVEGTVQRSGNRVQVTARLIRAQIDSPVWTKIYERDFRDALALQSELAQAIVSEIRVQLTPQERQHLVSPHTVNPDAYNAYLLGTYHASKQNLAETDKAIEYFQRAIRIDPGYAQAYAGLASGYLERDLWGGFGIGKAADQVRMNALKALELDGDLAEAHTLLAWIHFQYDWDWERTETQFKRAIELNANLPLSFKRYAFFLQTMGRDQEALAAVHRAVELDPLSPTYYCDEGRILYRAHQYQKAIVQYERALELDPGYLLALWRMSDAYEQLGNDEEALAWAQKYQEVSADRRPSLGLKARIYGRTGKQREAEETLKTLKKNYANSVDEYFLASIYSAMGDRDRAMAELEKMVEKRSTMPFVLRDPQLDSLRTDSRFQQLLRRAGLPY